MRVILDTNVIIAAMRSSVGEYVAKFLSSFEWRAVAVASSRRRSEEMWPRRQDATATGPHFDLSNRLWSFVCDFAFDSMTPVLSVPLLMEYEKVSKHPGIVP